MKKLYKFYWDVRRMGSVDGLFVADEAEIEKAIGKEIYFGEILGKHSDIQGELEATDLTVASDDQDFIAKLVEVIGSEHISGYNPLDYLEE
jgi:hypothetical protein